PTVVGRWSLLPVRDPDPTVRAHALARALLDRHGVVTRGAVSAEGVEGGFSTVYRILSAFEESGQARRGYVVEGLGAAQFAMDGAVDRLRAVAGARERGEGLPGTGSRGGGPDGFGSSDGLPLPGDLEAGFPAADPGGEFDWPAVDRPAPGEYVSPRDIAPPGHGGPRGGGRSLPYGSGPGFETGFGDRRGRTASADSRALVLAAADPANAYGAALPWPEPPTGAGHKPGRKAGSLVVLVDGELTLYMERGGKTLLTWPTGPDGAAGDDPRLRAAAGALAAAARAGSLGTVTVERVNGASALTSPTGALLEEVGFIATPRGLRLRA
ncbi:DEAD/DEAH box helicase, partial [Streptomyces sp. NTH33]|uniref:Lhr family helicase n=1 Tax=Streptomyces sp. NTH33 TaxID=1735453 RepID=UPI000DB464EA